MSIAYNIYMVPVKLIGRNLRTMRAWVAQAARPSERTRLGDALPTKKLEEHVAKVNVTVKAVEVANAKMQVSRTHGYDRSQPLGHSVVKPASPSRSAIAEAGQRALQSFNK